MLSLHEQVALLPPFEKPPLEIHLIIQVPSAVLSFIWQSQAFHHSHRAHTLTYAIAANWPLNLIRAGTRPVIRRAEPKQRCHMLIRWENPA